MQIRRGKVLAWDIDTLRLQCGVPVFSLKFAAQLGSQCSCWWSVRCSHNCTSSIILHYFQLLFRSLCTPSCSPHHITVIQWGQYNGSVEVPYHTKLYSIFQSPQHLYNFDCSPVDVPLTSIPFFPLYLYLCTDVLIVFTSPWTTLSSCTYRRNTNM